MVNVDPKVVDLERKRLDEDIPAHLAWLPETAQLRLPVLNGYRSRAIPEILRVLANNIEDTVRSHTLTRGQVAFDIYGFVRGAQLQIDGKVKKRKG